jgi:Na+/proline symporter
MIKILNKKIGIAILMVIFTLFLANFASASYNFAEQSGLNLLAGKVGYEQTPKSPEAYIGQILMLVFSLVGIIFLALTIYAGVHWMTAQGNSSQVEKAKDTLIKAIVGLVIIMAAYAITFFVINAIQAPVPADGTTGKTLNYNHIS